MMLFKNVKKLLNKTFIFLTYLPQVYAHISINFDTGALIIVQLKFV